VTFPAARYGLMSFGLVRIHGRREVNTGTTSEPHGLVTEPGEVAEHLNELEAHLLGRLKEALEMRAELRLTADELHLAAAEFARLAHHRQVVVHSQKVTVSRLRARLRVAVDALQIAAIRQLQPQEIQARTDPLAFPLASDWIKNYLCHGTRLPQQAD
jgi:hypothetical protein